MPPKLINVVRMDSMPLKAQYTAEGFLTDKPILTSTGIFEYKNPDGSVRRELRLPEDVFDSESLKSYKGKPIIITHEAGLITKDNVGENQIGTILSEGFRSGNDVRADIIIHDTDEMKECGLKELSLGYNLDLDETAGVWEGQPYDAVQKNIRINHLALVREARAGEQARLNLDGRSEKTLIGGKVMKSKATRSDGVLSPEELQKAIDEYKARKAEKTDADEPVVEEETTEVVEAPEKLAKEDEETTEVPETVEEKVDYVNGRRDRRDEAGDPKNPDEAMGVIAHQDEDIDMLLDIIDTLLAEREFKAGNKDAEEEVPAEETPADKEAPAEEEDVLAEDADEDIPENNKEVKGETVDEMPKVKLEKGGLEAEDADDVDDEDEEHPAVKIMEDETKLDGCKMNADSVDAIVRQRIKFGMVGRMLNMDGLENLSAKDAKKAIINKVRPDMRLDGKSNTYIDAAYDLAVKEAERLNVKDTNYQRKQMFNKDSKETVSSRPSAMDARARMIARMHKEEEK